MRIDGKTLKDRDGVSVGCVCKVPNGFWSLFITRFSGHVDLTC
jgi:hypothetical protein